jgi:hypothetical protein
MDAYLNAGFGEPLGQSRLKKIHELGFVGIRTGPVFGMLNNVDIVIDELEASELYPLFLFGDGYMDGWTPELFYEMTTHVARRIKRENLFEGRPIYFEIGNEPDIAVPLWRQSPKYLADTFWECYRYTKAICGRIELITGGISNLHENGLDWLSEFMEGLVQDSAIIGFHRYPNGADMTTPHDGFPSREHEWNKLRSLAGGRRLFCTETGMSTGPHRESKGFPLCWLHNNVYMDSKAQAEAFRVEYGFLKRRGVEGMVWYQHRDGPNRNRLLDNYGILDVYEVEKKPVCDVIRDTLL